jgi:hypothetical protein
LKSGAFEKIVEGVEVGEEPAIRFPRVGVSEGRMCRGNNDCVFEDFGKCIGDKCLRCAIWLAEMTPWNERLFSRHYLAIREDEPWFGKWNNEGGREGMMQRKGSSRRERNSRGRPREYLVVPGGNGNRKFNFWQS